MDCYFIRHKVDEYLTSEKILQMHKDKMIGVHYDDSSSVNPEDYKGRGKSALEMLKNLSTNGGYIMVEYVTPELENILFFCQVNKGIEEVKAFDPLMQGNNQMKGLKINYIKEIQLFECPVIFALRPRHHTVCRWHRVEHIINRINEDQKLCLEYLEPVQLEIMCSEYMRQKGLIDAFLLPVGRTLKDLDIIGIKDTNMIGAQVTFSGDTDSKIKSLLSYTTQCDSLYYFTAKDDYDKYMNVPKLRVVRLQQVFDEMKESQLLKEFVRNLEVLKVSGSGVDLKREINPQ